jgi:hypothetical protein
MFWLVSCGKFRQVLFPYSTISAIERTSKIHVIIIYTVLRIIHYWLWPPRRNCQNRQIATSVELVATFTNRQRGTTVVAFLPTLLLRHFLRSGLARSVVLHLLSSQILVRLVLHRGSKKIWATELASIRYLQGRRTS